MNNTISYDTLYIKKFDDTIELYRNQFLLMQGEYKEIEFLRSDFRKIVKKDLNKSESINGSEYDTFKWELKSQFDYLDNRFMNPAQRFMEYAIEDAKAKVIKMPQKDKNGKIYYDKDFFKQSTDIQLLEFCAVNTAQSCLLSCLTESGELALENPNFIANFSVDSFKLLQKAKPLITNFSKRINCNLPKEKLQNYFYNAGKYSNLTEDDVDNFLGAFFEGFEQSEFNKKFYFTGLAKRSRAKINTTYQFIFNLIRKETKTAMARKSSNTEYAILLEKAFSGFEYINGSDNSYEDHIKKIKKKIRNYQITLHE